MRPAIYALAVALTPSALIGVLLLAGEAWDRMRDRDARRRINHHLEADRSRRIAEQQAALDEDAEVAWLEAIPVLDELEAIAVRPTRTRA